MSKWIKKDDKVLVIAGNEKGNVGTVVRRKGDRVVIKGLNIRKKHLKRKSQEASSQILDIEAPIHISNVCICNEEGKPVKLKVRISKEGQKELYFIENGKDVVFRQIKKS